MTNAERDKMREVCQMIADDAEQDSMKLDGLVLSGRVVGENFGQVYASIKSLAKIVDCLLDGHSRGEG